MERSAAEPRILHRSDRWLVVDKPAGWHSVALPSAKAEASSGFVVEHWLRREVPGQAMIEQAGLVHRLDLGTSGCLLAARNEAARAELRAAFSSAVPGVAAHSGAAGRIGKGYLALVRPLAPRNGAFSLYFHGRHRRSSKVSVRERGDAGERGECRWERIDGVAEGDLLEVELLGPGRRHQVRAGFAHLGHPLAGDALYGGGRGLPGLDGAALHAWWLEVDGVRVVAPPPNAWAQFQDAIRRRLAGRSSTSPTSAG